MAVFPSLNYDFLMWKQSFPQVMDWFDRATEIRTGKVDDIETNDDELDDSGFVYDKKLERWT